MRRSAAQIGDKKMEKKPYKSGGDFSRDGNGNKILFTKRQVMARHKKMCRQFGWNGLTKFYVNDFGDYWTASAC